MAHTQAQSTREGYQHLKVYDMKKDLCHTFIYKTACWERRVPAGLEINFSRTEQCSLYLFVPCTQSASAWNGCTQMFEAERTPVLAGDGAKFLNSVLLFTNNHDLHKLFGVFESQFSHL